MVFGELKDQVRQNIGIDDLPNDVLDYIMDGGRREIEKRGNWYYMVNSVLWNLTIGGNIYTITGGIVGATNFKDIRILLEKTPDTTLWNEVRMRNFQYVDQVYATDDSGEPVDAVIDNTILTLFPPEPDKAYNMKMHFWNWTDNPAGNLDTDELCTRWPELLIYAATMFGMGYLNRDMVHWPALFEAEMTKFVNYNNERSFAEAVSMDPRTGPKFTSTFRN